MSEFILDTNVFNKILDNKIDISKFLELGHKYYVTHIQRDEILNTKADERRHSLIALFFDIVDLNIPTESAVVGVSRVGGAKIIPTESAVFGVSCWGQCKFTAKNNLFEPIKDALDKIKNKKNNLQDALIAETSIKNGYILITNDVNLATIVKDYNGKVLSFNEFYKSHFKKYE